MEQKEKTVVLSIDARNSVHIHDKPFSKLRIKRKLPLFDRIHL
jgi:hypothetical protein